MDRFCVRAGIRHVVHQPIEADYDSLPNAILYRNIDGLGWNRGVNADVWVNGVRVGNRLGVTWLRSSCLNRARCPTRESPWNLHPIGPPT